MGYKKGKKELGIYYAKTLVSIAEEISAKNAGKEKAGIQKIFSVLQRSGGIIRKNMTYLVTHWIYRLSLFTHGKRKNCGQWIWQRKYSPVL